MSPILHDLAPEAVIPTIEDNAAACMRFLAGLPGCEVAEDAELTTVVTGLPAAAFNGVFRTRFAPDVAEEHIRGRIAAVYEHIRPHSPAVGWMVVPSSRPADLSRHLEAQGFSLADESRMMARGLDRLDETTRELAPAGLTVEPVRDKAALAVWIHTANEGFGFPHELDDIIYHLAEAQPLGPEQAVQLFLARLDGEPVATSYSAQGGGVVGIYNVATVPPARGKGIGYAVTLAALRDARERGYAVAVLGATRMGFPVYQRMGFRDYCAILHYERQS